MKRLFFLALILLPQLAQWGMAQTPKWLDKSRMAIFSIITFDKDDKILNTGNGFFISEDGMALSDYALFKGAQRAVVVDASGKKLPVSTIQGVNSMYDVLKFKVSTEGKKVSALPIATAVAAEGSMIYLLPYSTQKTVNFTTGKVKEVSSIGSNQHYYSFDMKIDEKQVSCPVVNSNGEAIGLAQLPSGSDSGVSYGISASYGAALSIAPLSFNDPALKGIGIKKGMPETEDQALVYLYMAAPVLTPVENEVLLSDFIAAFPNSSEGYLRRANNYIYISTDVETMTKAAADMERAITLNAKKDDAYYNLAKLIYTYQLTSPETTYKDWTLDKALSEVRTTLAVDSLPLYLKLEGDILYAKREYVEAFNAYERVNKTNLVTPATLFSAVKAKELAGGTLNEVIALMDSCIALCGKPMVSEYASYLLERANYYIAAEQFRQALSDYDTYYDTVRGNVNDMFYYYREQAALYARQYQRALDDINKAIELDPDNITYRLELSVVNIRVGRNEDALNVLEEAAKIDRDNSDIYRLKGLAFAQLKNNKEACENLQKAKALGNPNVDSLIEKYCK